MIPTPIKSKRGGRRPGAGRKKNVPNKLTFQLKQAAAEYGEEALITLVSLIRNEEMPPNVTLGACKEILDRGFGKPAVTIDTPPLNINVFPAKEVLDAIYETALAQAAERDRMLTGRRERLGILIEHDQL
ncbi:hypothetical protein [Methylobacter sp.]|uniref:hypothetical protein n=1 Tax=Methylobacter sp. TaxID=2051955 RepID=UPI00248752FF|nr:hypothetical protein [Methylobacter sp.]MDI1277286.1 hypothetical protein [Methylobacter sp.]MDI1357852.1 hypothetical protein [Methylobacter sp.]